MHRISTDTLRYYDKIDLFKANIAERKTGYFNKVRDEIPSLLKYIEKNGYEVGGDCYVLKI